MVTAFGVGMALGMASTNQVAKFVERGITFVWALVAAGATLFVLASMPNLPPGRRRRPSGSGAFCGLAWVSGYTLLQENVEDEFRGRTFASLTTLSRMGLFLSLTVFPILSTVYGDYEFFVGWAAVRPVGHAARALDRRGAGGGRRAQHAATAATPSPLATRNPSRSCRS